MNHSTVIQFIAIAIVGGTPLVFASVGETLAQRSGVMNLGLEGVMLLGAVIAFWVTASTHSVWLGLFAGAGAGCALSGVHAVLSVSLRANQIISGIAIVIIGTGLSEFIGDSGTQPLTTRAPGGSFTPVFHGWLANLPIVGPLIFGQNALVYMSWLFVAGASFYLFHTRAGLWLRSVGEDPSSADAAGISVARTRYVHVLIGGAAAGVAGAYLTLAMFNAWRDNLSGGLGWIAVAIVIFCGRRPGLALLASYLFGAVTSIGFELQLFHVAIPTQILAMLPYLLTLVALVMASSDRFARLRSEPAALGKPYWRESR